MTAIALTCIANLLVGACIGLTGIAGFLLPMFYISVLALSPIEALALAFGAFIVSGLLGCPAYRKTGNLPLRTCAWLLLGSLIGACFGVQIGLVLPADLLKIILYVVVLCSGVSVLLRMRPRRAGRKRNEKRQDGSSSAAVDGIPHASPRKSAAILFCVGLATAVVCAASGAGGPVLVVPILLLLGFSPRTAVGISLIDSVFVSIPSACGYLLSGQVTPAAWSLLAPALIAHGIGVIAGSRYSKHINGDALKLVVSIGSIIVALLKLAGF